jgi:hypothetical protein
MRTKLSLVVESEGCEVGVNVVVIIFFLGQQIPRFGMGPARLFPASYVS